MKLSLYTFAALTFILLVGGFVYILELGEYRLDMINIMLPVAIWVVLPLILLFLFTVVHILFYGMRNYFQIKKWKKATVALEDALYWSLVNEPKEQKYAIEEIGSSAVLLGKASIDVSDNIEGLTPRLARVVNIIQKIKNGEYIDLKEHKMAKVFKPGNPILIQNRLNRIESDKAFVEDVMRATSDYSEMVQKEALKVFARKTDFETARKYAKVFDVKNFLVMLERVNNEDNLGLNSEILTDFVNALELHCADYIKVAVITKKYFKPDENLILFRSYQANDEKAQNAYLYLLFEYELLDQASNYLDEQEKSEFVKFRALKALKQEHDTFRLEDIIDINSICNETRPY